MLQFTDSLSENKELVAELIRGMPGTAQARARRVALGFERYFNQTVAAFPKDPAAALGAAFAIYELASRITRMERGAEGAAQGIIEVVSK